MKRAEALSMVAMGLGDRVHELKKENARYRAALEAIVDGMWIDQTSRETLYQSTQDACQLADRALKGEAADVLDRIVEEDTL